MDTFISKKKLREFGIIIGFGFPIFLGLIIPMLFGHGFRSWTLFIGIPSLIFGILRPQFLKLPFRIWMKLGMILGWFNSRLILGLVFLIVLVPISLIMNLFGHDPLKKKFNRKSSYKENTQTKNIDLKRIF